MTIPHRRPIMIVLALSFVLLAGNCREPSQAGQLERYDLQTRKLITGTQAMDALKIVRLVIVGEHHTDRSHHKAQLVRDTAMAINAIAYLEQHPDRVMVLLAGSGHTRKMGIPFQVKSRSPVPFAGLLPHTPDIIEPDSLTAANADFIIMP